MKAKPTKQYRSKLEHKVALLLGEEWKYESGKIPYTMYRNYTPDFTKGNKLIEVKGFFRPGDQAKYLAIRDSIRIDGKELIFIFPNPNKPVRRGAKLTHKVWCEKNDIRCLSVADITRGTKI